jgi:hypothetical protein
MRKKLVAVLVLAVMVGGEVFAEQTVLGWVETALFGTAAGLYIYDLTVNGLDNSDPVLQVWATLCSSIATCLVVTELLFYKTGYYTAAPNPGPVLRHVVFAPAPHGVYAGYAFQL